MKDYKNEKIVIKRENTTRPNVKEKHKKDEKKERQEREKRERKKQKKIEEKLKGVPSARCPELCNIIP